MDFSLRSLVMVFPLVSVSMVRVVDTVMTAPVISDWSDVVMTHDR